VAGMAGGTGSAVVDGVTGMRVNGNEVAAVTLALRRLLDDPLLARRMGEAGLARVQGEFAWERVADKMRQMQIQIQE
jgi:phosphatidyl-myo-inositol dimannoside synthase